MDAEKDFASLRIQLDLNDALEREIGDLWKSGVQVADGVRVKGKHLFLHAMARLIKEDRNGKQEESKKVEIPEKKPSKSLGGDWN
jgi:hypothetical protein